MSGVDHLLQGMEMSNWSFSCTHMRIFSSFISIWIFFLSSWGLPWLPQTMLGEIITSFQRGLAKTQLNHSSNESNGFLTCHNFSIHDICNMVLWWSPQEILHWIQQRVEVHDNYQLLEFNFSMPVYILTLQKYREVLPAFEWSDKELPLSTALSLLLVLNWASRGESCWDPTETSYQSDDGFLTCHN